MPIKLTNTLTRKKQTFEPLEKGKVGIYSCGPTVYNYQHIGNFRTAIMADVLKRMFKLNGVSVKHVMNITDVDDKILAAAEKNGVTPTEIAEKYTDIYFSDLAALNILQPTKWTKATEYIQEMITLVQELESKGFTYRIDDGVYFDTSKFPAYGKLGGQSAEEKKAGARVELGDKKNHTDFALWKLTPTGSSRAMEWDSPWGKGFPGWHIECSAMASKELGQPFDIHTGGADLAPVHHENEIAQSEAAHQEQLANYWVHGAMLDIHKEKMSKSLSNFYTISDLVEKGFDPLAYRYLTFSAHYHVPLNFTWEALEAAQNALNNIRDEIRGWEKPTGVDDESLKVFTDRVSDDLDMPGAVAEVWQLVKDEHIDTGVKAATLLKYDEVLGLKLADYVAKAVEVPLLVLKMIEDREKARQKKDFVEADRLREAIEQEGFVVEDSANGQRVREKHA